MEKIRRMKSWQVGIQNPFNLSEIIKVLKISNGGVATSGNYQRGQHILNPKTNLPADEIASADGFGPNIYRSRPVCHRRFCDGGKRNRIYRKDKKTGGIYGKK